MWKETRRSISHFLWSIIKIFGFTNGNTTPSSRSEAELEEGEVEMETNVPQSQSRCHAGPQKAKAKKAKKVLKAPTYVPFRMNYNQYCA
jgi:hypothetical protein